jgi:hypothetical protein
MLNGEFTDQDRRSNQFIAVHRVEIKTRELLQLIAGGVGCVTPETDAVPGKQDLSGGAQARRRTRAIGQI